MRRSQRWASVVSGHLCACALIAASAAIAQPASEPASAEPAVSQPAPPAGDAQPPVTQDDPRKGWRHEFSPAWHMATFWSKEDSHYTFHSLALT